MGSGKSLLPSTGIVVHAVNYSRNDMRVFLGGTGRQSDLISDLILTGCLVLEAHVMLLVD